MTSQRERDLRVESQRRIADAFDVPHWIAGVEGARPPWPVRLRMARRRWAHRLWGPRR